MPELIHILIWLLVLVLVAALVFYILSQFPLPEPLGNIVKVIIVVLFCLIAISILLQLAGGFGAIGFR